MKGRGFPRHINPVTVQQYNDDKVSAKIDIGLMMVNDTDTLQCEECTTETLENWAARVAPSHNWKAHRRVFRGRYTNDDLEAMAEAGLITINEPNGAYDSRHTWSINAQAVEVLEDYRDRLAAGLVECERDVLMKRGDWGSASPAASEALRARKLHTWIRGPGGMMSERTPLGDEIARVLEDHNE